MSRLFSLSLILSVFLYGCTPPSETLKPIAKQNSQNIQALTTNVNALLALYEPMLISSGNAMMYQKIAKMEQELISVVGAPVLPLDQGATWQSLFEDANEKPVGQQEKYLDRYQNSRKAIEQITDVEELKRLRQNEGWIFQAAIDSSFTPAKAKDLLQQISILRQNNRDKNDVFYAEAEKVFTPYNPQLGFLREMLQTAKTLLNGLKNELGQQLEIAATNAKSISAFTNAELDIKQTLVTASGSVDSTELENTLNALSQKYLNKSTVQEAAIDYLVDGVQKLWK